MIRGDSGSTLQGTPGQCNHKPKKVPRTCLFVGVNRLHVDSGPSPIIRECVTGALGLITMSLECSPIPAIGDNRAHNRDSGTVA